MKKTLLITGGTGYIGSIAVVEFEKAGYNTIVLDNLSNSKKDVLKNIEKLTQNKINFYNIDLLDKKALDKVFKENKIDGVLHFAGLKAVGESCQLPLKYFENNITGSINLFEVMQKNNVKNIIFSSSATVYDLYNAGPDLIEKKGNDIILKRGLKETDPTGNTTNPYGRTKYLIEQILEDLSKFSNFNSIILRYFNPIGAHTSGILGEDPNGIPNNLAPYIMKVLKGELKHLNIFGNDYPTKDGTGIRDYIDVNDLVKGHIQAYKNLENNLNGFFEVFNLGVGKGVSVLELVKLVEKVSGKNIPYQIVKRRDGDLAENYCNADKANQDLNWKAITPIEESIKTMINFYKI